MARAPRRDLKSVDGGLERAIPHNLEAEESLLGAMLLSRDAIADALEFCQASDFYKPSHVAIFEALASLHSRGESSDPVSVADELRRQDKLETVGGTASLLELQAKTPTIASAARYARIVEEYSLLRKLIRVATEISELSYSVPENVGAVIDMAETLIFEVSQRKSAETLVSIKDVLLKTLDELQAQYEHPDSITGVATGFHELDEILSGLQRSALIIVGARPAMGKTSFALGIATQVATRANLPVLIFSLEMSHIELTQRILAAEARVDSRKMRTGNLSEEDWSRISRSLGHLGEAPIFIDDNASVTVLDIRAKARRLKAATGGLGLVVVDYLQLMSGGFRSESRQVEVSEISRGLKLLARELEVPVLALSQLSRGLEMRQDKRPALADLRESGCIAGTSKVCLANGETISIGALERLWGLGETKVLTMNSNGDLVSSPISDVRFSGFKETTRLELLSGRYIDATLNHRFFTRRGWKMLWQLNDQDEVAVYPTTSQSTQARGRQGDHQGDMTRTVYSYVADDSQGGPTFRGGLAVLLRNEQDGHIDSLSSDLSEDIEASVESNPLFLGDDLSFEPVVAARSMGLSSTYDIVVPATSNFIANEIVVHNSLEQDADVVMFIYRDEVYNAESQDKGIAEIIVTKHRSGPTGVARLSFLESYTKFANMARGPGNQ
ncbi:replicative DNA helicase [Acidithrix sp. C25]|uniref:replicative DNA helicase n=1 Tax=Acidithrix sp. C25 TaxID=1671482 RepID=UPI00191BA386|nr:replicative DNA helicase [Acidithrix sp. C25]